MSAKDQFEAAVKVIQGLPKDGPFQPSHAMMLQFYGYFKQATEGDCNIAKPSFWEVIKKAKYEAWKARQGMKKEVAMMAYVDELKKIIETMSFNADVATFMEVLGPFYEYLAPNSVGNDREEEKEEGIDMGENRPEVDELVRMLGKYDDEGEQQQSDESEEEDVVEDSLLLQKGGELLLLELEKAKIEVAKLKSPEKPNLKPTMPDDEETDEDEYKDVYEEQPDGRLAMKNEENVEMSLKEAVRLLNAEVSKINARLSVLESANSSSFKQQQQQSSTSRTGILGNNNNNNNSNSSSIYNNNNKTLLFLLLWPFVAQGLVAVIKSLRRTR